LRTFYDFVKPPARKDLELEISIRKTSGGETKVMDKTAYEQFESHLDDLVRWGYVKVDLDENGVEVYSLAEPSLEDLDRCRVCGDILPHSSDE